MSVHLLDFREYVVKPVLARMGLPNPELAGELILKIFGWESGGCYRLDQVDRERRDGPAYGPGQFEKIGFQEVHRLLGLGNGALGSDELRAAAAKYRLEDIRDLRCRLDSAVFYARILLWPDKERLPGADDWWASHATYLRVWRPGKPPTLDAFREAFERWEKA